MKPIWKNTPVSSTVRSIARASSSEIDGGFSQKLPCHVSLPQTQSLYAYWWGNNSTPRLLHQ
jgi:hypothetical protein